MDTLTYLILLRLLHICCGVFWAGAAIYLSFFVGPAVQASGPEGVKVMQQLAKTNRLPLVMMLAGIITIVAGYLLLWKLSGGFASAWMSTKHGMVLSTGVALGTIAFLIGFFVIRPSVDKINNLGKVIAAAGGPPNPEQIQQLGAIRKKIFAANRIVAILLIFTVVSMSIIRYL